MVVDRRRSRSLNGPGIRPERLQPGSFPWLTELADVLRAVVNLPWKEAALGLARTLQGQLRRCCRRSLRAARHWRHWMRTGITKADIGILRSSTCSGRITSETLASFSVRQLKVMAQELGVNATGCTEKADLVTLLSAASSRSSSPPEVERSNAHRSLHRCNGAFATPSAPATPIAAAAAVNFRPEAARSRQQQEILRIGKAKDDVEVLSMSRSELQNLRTNEDRERAVLRRFREISRIVHPDKCPPALRDAATKAFQRLEVAKRKLMETTLPTEASASRNVRSWV